MKVIHPDDTIPQIITKSIFLAGPTLRNNDDFKKSWRSEACDILKKRGYDGVVFVPEPFTKKGWEAQISWEDRCLNMADCIVFWIPRSIDLPGYTTNVEYGEWMKSGKIVLGFPKDAEKVRYLENKAKENNVPISNKLEETLKEAVSFIGDGVRRKDGDRYVPAFLWDTPSFQAWYENLKKSGNKLEEAKLLWTYRVGPKDEVIFSWVLKVDIYITKEKRIKSNEFVFSRSDISAVVAYYPKPSISDTEIVFIKEFRSSVSNKEGFVHEIPGGSSKDEKEDPLEVVVTELFEETGLKVNKKRFKFVQTRQLSSTLSAHRMNLYVLKLTEKEYKETNKNQNKVFGVKKDTERSYLMLKRFGDIFEDERVDWSMLGGIFRAMLEKNSEDVEKEASDWVGSFL